MASLRAAYALSSRVIRQRVAAETSRRGLATSPRCLAAQNFTMPALSPTMTEGNIAAWKVKEGDSFAAGDVLLEIETDKATMDVEAQEDGVMMKITQADGAKSVQVGTRIAVLAEPGDDVSALELPPDEKPQAEAKPDKAVEGEDAAGSEAKAAREAKPPTGQGGGKTYKQTYPLYPSVAHLVHENGLDEAAVSGITPTGPNGRLLKGDVLAYLGSIKSETPGRLSSMYSQLAHLDLSNVKPAKRDPAPAEQQPQQQQQKKKAAEDADAAPPPPAALELTLPVSLAKVLEVQGRVQQALGVDLPVDTFVARAAEFANDDLPAAEREPTADELFDQVLGLDAIGTGDAGTRGFYLPQVAAPSAAATSAPAPPPGEPDIIDLLAGASRPRAAASRAGGGVAGAEALASELSLVVPRGEEKRAMVFLERVKVILEKGPGRLVL